MEANNLREKYFLLTLTVLFYVAIQYFLPRENNLIFIVYSLLFFAYIRFLRLSLSFKEVFLWAMVLRFIPIFAYPGLSDDIYRFIWDGRLIINNINPYVFLPSEVQGSFDGLNESLYKSLNSPNYYSVYPPFAQVIYAISQFIFPKNVLGSIIVIRIILIAFEAGTVFLIYKLLTRYRQSGKLVKLYAFNPLVIMELSGNLHFEGVVIFFILLSVYLMIIRKYRLSGIAYGLGIATKLIPLIFLPLFLRRIKFPSLLIWCSFIVVCVFILVFPFLDWSFLEGLRSGLSLYFQKFEFNASIYYLFREYGFYSKGYNIIQTLGPNLAIVVIFLVMAYTLFDRQKKRRLFEGFMWIILIYLSFSTTVHPWYIVYLIAFSLFSDFRFPVIWSYTIFLTYLGYNLNGYVENPVIISFEYITLFMVIGYEIFVKASSKGHRNKLLRYLS